MYEYLQQLKEIQQMLDLYSSLTLKEDNDFLFTYDRTVKKHDGDEHSINWYVSSTKIWYSISVNGETIKTFIDDINTKNINESLSEVQHYFINLSLV